MDSILAVCITQSLFTATFLLTRPRLTTTDKILGVWMIFIALPFIGGATVRAWPDVHIPILRAELIYPLTYGPFMWLYVRAVTGDMEQMNKQEFVHFLPFFCMSVLQLVTGWTPPPPNPNAEQFDVSIRLIGALNLGIMLGYSVAVFRRMIVHRREVVQHFSSLSNRITLNWLMWLTVAICLGFLMLFFASAFSLPSLLRFHLPAQLGIILAMSFFGLRQVQVFDRSATTATCDVPPKRSTRNPQQDLLPEPSDATPQEAEKESYSRSGLSTAHADKIFQKLARFMAAERPYLSADLTISDLAKQISVSRHHLTEVINTRHNQSFYAFINEYRVEAIIREMKTPEGAQKTLLELAYDNGFNSKSPFNAAFKKVTGKTPSHYRRQIT